MARRVEFGGKVHDFPDDTTDDEIASVLESSGSALPTDAQIQANVKASPNEQSGQLENALGNALTFGLGGSSSADIGRGAMDTVARWENNLGSMLGSTTEDGLHTPERAAELNAMLQPQNTAQSIGGMMPGAGVLAATGGIGGGGLAGAAINGAISGGLTALDTGDLGKAGITGAATAAAGVPGALLSKIMTPAAQYQAYLSRIPGGPTPETLAGKVASFTPAVKWETVQILADKLIKGTIGGYTGAEVGEAAGVGRGTGAAIGATLGQFIPNITKDMGKKLVTAIQGEDVRTIARILWRALPPAIAHMTGSEPSFDSTDKLMNADSPAALADLAKKRQQAQSVLR